MIIALIEDHPITLNLYAEMLIKSRAVSERDRLLRFLSADEFYTYCRTCKELNRLEEKFPIGKTPIYSEIADVIICDYNLGRNQIDGYNLLKELQSGGFDGLAVLLTADNSDEMIQRMEHTPSIKYVFKGAKKHEDNPYVILKRLIDQARTPLGR